MYSERFGKDIIVTNHARQRMAEREISEAVLLDIIETGEVLRVDHQHVFLFKPIPARHDNLACVAAVEEAQLVVKTVMVDWTLRRQP